jgi:Tol biopolymer transport system component
MGEVYEATDTRLGRTVAIKILPSQLSDHEDMKARFEREAQTIAGLSHPNICTLHDVGEDSVPDDETGASATSVSYLVLEHLAGETVADRIARGPIPLVEALPMAIAIADALDKAHKEGIVHRDLKPANVMLTDAGPKLLDFGLAKWAEPDSSDGLAAMPTRADVTAKGTMLGTLQYMAPEQIEGKEADARTDIFGLGALLYEMITGQRAFEGKTQATLMSAIMSREPRPLSHLAADAPSALEHVVERCLAKDPDDRWQSARSLVIQLQWIAYGDDTTTAPVAEDDRKRERVALMALAGAAALALALAIPAYLYWQGSAATEPFTFRVPIRGYQDAAVAPDGSGIVFAAKPSAAGSALYYRPIGGLTSVRLDGTDEATYPFWSPDSRFVAFATGDTLKKIDVTGGPAQNLASVPGFTGGTWNEAGMILYGSTSGIFRVSAEGGTPEPVTTVEAPATGHYWPRFLPDGVSYMFLVWAQESADRALHVGSLESPDHMRVGPLQSQAVYVEPGYLVSQRESAVYAQPFDLDSRMLTGEPVRLAGAVAFQDSNGHGWFDVSQTGTLLYFEGATEVSARGENPGGMFSRVARSGGIGGPVGEAGPWGDMDLSPDGTKLAVTRVEGGSGDIWIIDWQRGDQGVATRLTLDSANDLNPVWSPDGERVAFTSYRNGNADVLVMNANGVGEAQALLASEDFESVEDWSSDGKYLAYLREAQGQTDIYVLPLEDEGEPFAVVEGPFNKDEPQFSPDGRWIAYASDESGDFEVYVKSFPDGEQREKASVDGGGQPRWSLDGRELFYRAPGGAVRVVAVATDPRLDIGSPELLFNRNYQPGYSNSPTRHQWAVSPEGGFVMRSPHLQTQATGPGATVRSWFVAGDSNSRTAAAPALVNAANLGPTVILDWLAGIEGGDR